MVAVRPCAFVAVSVRSTTCEPVPAATASAPVEALRVTPAGSAAPPARVALQVRAEPFGSVTVAATDTEPPAATTAVRATLAAAACGAAARSARLPVVEMTKSEAAQVPVRRA